MVKVLLDEVIKGPAIDPVLYKSGTLSLCDKLTQS